MTWGGKLLRSAHLLKEDLGYTDMSFAEPYIKKRRADCSLPEEGEGTNSALPFEKMILQYL